MRRNILSDMECLSCYVERYTQQPTTTYMYVSHYKKLKYTNIKTTSKGYHCPLLKHTQNMFVLSVYKSINPPNVRYTLLNVR